MKYFGLLCVFLILVNFSMQLSEFENCSEDEIEAHTSSCECCKVICSETEVELQSCSVSQCAEGTHVGYHDPDNTLMFPACCGYPICSEE